MFLMMPHIYFRARKFLNFPESRIRDFEVGTIVFVIGRDILVRIQNFNKGLEKRWNHSNHIT